MTPALKAMVEAMKAELIRQHREVAGADYADEGAREWLMTLDGHFDFEAVARAGLEALRDLDGEAMVDLILAGADMNDSVGVWWPRLVGSILKETP